jgi:hypothetical protein
MSFMDELPSMATPMIGFGQRHSCCERQELAAIAASRLRCSLHLSDLASTARDRGLARCRRSATSDGQRRRRPWSVSLATLFGCCGEEGQVAGLLHVENGAREHGHLAARSSEEVLSSWCH